MSGLLGYLGNKRALPVLIQGLKLMRDYHYDSSGIILKRPPDFFVRKKTGSWEELEREIMNYDGDEMCGGVHLRWATHGEISPNNAHPIFSSDGKVAVLHKGLIANFDQLKAKLITEGVNFSTQTDTEAVSNLIAKYYQGDLSSAVRQALMEVDGIYAMIVFYGDEKKEMVVANNGAGLMMGIGRDEYWVTMDKKTIYPFTDKVVYLNDAEMVKISDEGFVSSVIGGGAINVITKNIETIRYNDSDMDEYFDQIESEIFSQPEMVKQIMAGRIDEQKVTAHFGGLGDSIETMRQVSRLIFTGSGSSFYSAMIARELIEDYVAVAVSVYSGLEMRMKRFVLSHDKTALFAISQSGQTPDTVAAMREAMQLGMQVFGITNTVGSPVARETKSGIFLHSGPTLGMPSMRSFMSQLVVLVLLTLYIGRLKGLSPASGRQIINALKRLPEDLNSILARSLSMKNMVKNYANAGKFWLVGVKYGYPLALETALILGKLGQVMAEGTNLAELEYGLIDQIKEGHVVVFLMTSDSVVEGSIELMRRIKQKGAKLIIFAEEKDLRLDGLVDELVYLPVVKDIVRPVVTLMCLQLWVYYLVKFIISYRTDKTAFDQLLNADNPWFD